MLGVSIAVLSSFSAVQLGPQTLLIVNAAFLTLWYVECAILLASGFFAKLFGDELPFEIRFFVSFVIMVNAGYFTLMFLVSLASAKIYLVQNALDTKRKIHGFQGNNL